FCFLPLITAQFMQRRLLRITATVAADEMQARYRHVELGAVGVLKHQELCELSFYLKTVETEVAADTVIQMHDGRARIQFGEALEDEFALILEFAASALLADVVDEELVLRNGDEP